MRDGEMGNQEMGDREIEPQTGREGARATEAENGVRGFRP